MSYVVQFLVVSVLAGVAGKIHNDFMVKLRKAQAEGRL